MIYAILRGIMRLLTRGYLLGLFQVKGRELVPRTGPLLVCPNHSATLDPPMVPAFLPRGDTWSLAKSEYFARSLTSMIFSAYHAFPIVRHSADRRALRRGFDILKAGGALIIYPEGTRVEDGRLRRPEPGAGFIALRADARVQPVALLGTRECLPKGSHWPRRIPVSVTFGPPFRLAGRRPDGSRVSHQDAADAIMVRIAELLPPEKRGDFADLEAERARVRDLYLPA